MAVLALCCRDSTSRRRTLLSKEYTRFRFFCKGGKRQSRLNLDTCMAFTGSRSATHIAQVRRPSAMSSHLGLCARRGVGWCVIGSLYIVFGRKSWLTRANQLWGFLLQGGGRPSVAESSNLIGTARIWLVQSLDHVWIKIYVKWSISWRKEGMTSGTHGLNRPIPCSELLKTSVLRLPRI